MSTDIRDIPGLSVRPLHTPLHTTSAGGLPQVRLPSGHVATHVTRYPDVKAVLSDPTFLRACTNTDDGPSYLPTTMPPEMLLNLDMPDHARLKRLTNRLYSAAAMAASRESIDAAVAELTTRRETFDLVRDVLAPLTVRVNCTLLGIEHEEIPRFHELSVEMQMAPRDDVDHLKASFVELYRYIAELAHTHRTREDGLIATLLVQGSALEEPLTREEASAILLGSLVGGDQNVLSTVSKAVYVLLARRELWKELCADVQLVPSAVEELLRVLPLGTISTFPRVASRRLELPSGAIVTADEVVIADAGAANLDETVFPAPTSIDFRRAGPRHLQFGYGVHHCMGAALARLVITATVEHLVTKLPALRLDAAEETISWETGVLVHRPRSLPVVNAGAADVAA